MQSIKCIIIEDEPLAVRVLQDFCQQVPYLEVVGIFREAISASDFLRGEKVDLIFLDLHLPELKGFDFLRALVEKPAVIVTTAYHQYAVEGFELNVTDYLMKPISFPRFVSAINKAIKSAGSDSTKGDLNINNEKSIFLTVNRKKARIILDDILYVESKREYVQIVTRHTEFTSKISTQEIESLLPASKFKRIHRSFIVAIDKIDAYTREEVEIKGKTIPIGRSFRGK
jgi:two-component system, LytTR family, response regulator